MNPLNWDGPTFLVFYVLALIVAIPLAWILGRLARPGGRVQPLGDADSLAYLAGRETRLAEGVAARLMASGAIEVEGSEFRQGSGAAAAAASDRAVLALASPFGWKDIVAALRPESAALERRLVAGGLLLDAAERRRVGLIATAPFLLLLLVGGAKLLLGLARGKPILFLAILLVITLVIALVRWTGVSDQTRAGRSALKEARQEHDRLKRAPTARETDLAVALFGTTVLAGSAYAAFHQLRTPADSGGWSSDSSSSGSGCGGSDSGGGSGCGGCGGGGD
ncbi:MAG: TIGR04222 domain-containing membrane protein [Sphingopyxis sp.]|uniref:TIGR04222 domain-containing membrane protein n=1 Tax=Sphingopyxis sp. TaxID=1908224 RepID=UPI003D6CF4FE